MWLCFLDTLSWITNKGMTHTASMCYDPTYIQQHIFMKTVCVLRHQSICVSCACRTWCGATARKSALNGNTRWILSNHALSCYSSDCWVPCFLLPSLASLSLNVCGQMEQKMIASEIFKDKKDNYPQSVPKLFVSTRLGKLQTYASYYNRLAVILVRASYCISWDDLTTCHLSFRWWEH